MATNHDRSPNWSRNLSHTRAALHCCLALVLTTPLLLAAPSPAPPGERVLQGDLDCDGTVDMLDVAGFAVAHDDPVGWCEFFGKTKDDMLARGDFTGDDMISAADIPGLSKTIAEHLEGRVRPAASSNQPSSRERSCETESIYVDLDIDSDNDDGFRWPERDAEEEQDAAFGEEVSSKNVPISSEVDPSDRVPLILEFGCCEAASPCDDNPDAYPVAGTGFEFRLLHESTSGVQPVGVWTCRAGGHTCSGTTDPACDPLNPVAGSYEMQLSLCNCEPGECSAGDPQLICDVSYPFVVSLTGDMNNDGTVDFFDIGPFVTAVTVGPVDSDPETYTGYYEAYPSADWLAFWRADLNHDGAVDFFDLDPFEDVIVEPPGSGNPKYNMPVTLWLEGITADETTIRVQYREDDTQPWQDLPSGEAESVLVNATESCCENPSYHVPAGESISYGQHADCVAGAGQFEPQCWYFFQAHDGVDTPELEAPDGFPFHMNLAEGFGPPDLPPLSVNVRTSTSPLVPAGPPEDPVLSPFPERATQAGVVDLVTGQPLLQEVDFELTFGGAVFRHVRTYSESFIDHFFSRYHLLPKGSLRWSPNAEGAPEGTHWDWNGRYWMMSENPILLVDAAYPGTADWEGDPAPGFGVRICYFIPDAHHAVPFVDQEGDGSYIAPSWFDASLSYVGATKTNGEWNGEPTEFTVTTHGGSVIYHFEPHFDALWNYTTADEQTFNAHDHPGPDFLAGAALGQYNAGMGVPYYALVTAIEDRYGNTVEYVYEPSSGRTDCSEEWRDQVSAYYQTPDGPCCDHCCQACNKKGQIKAIKLRDASGTCIWTLLYTHRAFGGDHYWSGAAYDPYEREYYPNAHEAMHLNMLHSIHVYEGEVNVPGSLTLGYWDYFYPLTSFDEYDTVEHHAIPPGWVIRSQYVYHEFDDSIFYGGCPFYDGDCPGIQYKDFSSYLASTKHIDKERHYAGYQLLKATTSTTEADSSDVVTETAFYRYGPMWAHGSQCENMGTRHLETAYSNETCAWIMRYLTTEGINSINDFMVLEGSELLNFNVDGETESHSVAELADLTFFRHETLPTIESDSVVAMVDQHVSAPADQLYWVLPGVQTLVDRRSGEPVTHYFKRLHRYQQTIPEDFVDGYGAHAGNGKETHASYHWPFRYRKWWLGAEDAAERNAYHDLPAMSAFHIMAVDVVNEDVTTNYRRVVEMTPRGNILVDRTWHEDGGFYQDGFAEQRFYDPQGRLAMKCSKGWGSEENIEQQEVEGLVDVYLYEDSDSVGGEFDPRGQLWAIGARRGIGDIDLAGTAWDAGSQSGYADTNVGWLAVFEHHADRPALITEETRFSTPLQNWTWWSSPTLPEPGESTEYNYAFQDDDSSKGIALREVIRSATARERDGTLCYAVERTHYDTSGNAEWVITSSEPSVGGTPEEMYLTYREYDDRGRLVKSVFDAVPGVDGDPPAPPGGGSYDRVSEADALRLETTLVYDPVFGPSQVTKILQRGDENDVLETHYVYERVSGDSSRLYFWEFQYAGLGETRELKLPVKRTEYAGGRLRGVAELAPDSDPGCPPPEDPSSFSYSVLSETTPTYSPSGQLAGGTVDGGDQDDESISSRVWYHTGNLVSREVAPDGTITRYLYDSRDRLERTYRGTSDSCDSFWINRECVGSSVYWAECGPSADDDMALIEKRCYGSGVTNADQVVTIRTYDKKPLDQYCLDASEEDTTGRCTEVFYDWRMRPVWATEYSEEGCDAVVTELRHSLTWYDHQGRELLTAEYGPLPTAGLEAELDGIGMNPATATSFWQPEVGVAAVLWNEVTDPAYRPLSATEHIHNARGQAEETRHWYWDEGAGCATYTYEQTFYDHVDRPLEQYSPNAPVRQYAYDAKGRQVVSQSVAIVDDADCVVEKTETAYDANDRATQTTHSELDPDDASFIPTYTHTWYDKNGRIEATARFGTNHAANEFSAGSEPAAYDPDLSPATYDGDGNLTDCECTSSTSILYTCYQYDDAGNQTMIWHPDGTRTQHAYDGLKRVIRTTEDYEGEDRRTIYQYDDGGRLEAIAAVSDDYGGAIDNVDHVDTLIDSGTHVEVTKLYYDAPIWPTDWDLEYVDGDSPGWVPQVSVYSEAGCTGELLEFDARNPSAYYPEGQADQFVNGRKNLVSAVQYPGDLAADVLSLEFAYYADGSVAYRKDARGVAVYYQYDDLARLTDVWIDDTAAFPIDPPESWYPAERTRHIVYTYSNNGQLLTATAYADFEDSVVIATNTFTYNDQYNLTSETQDHGGASNPPSRTVQYAWEVGDWDDDNFTRLTQITYPAGGPVVTLDYGAADELDDVLNRVVGLSPYVTGYAHVGLGRRVATTLGNGVGQSFGSAGSYPGLDRYGRVADLTFTSQQLQHYEYGYDNAGNRTYALAEQDGHVNDRSYLYEYDGLRRLISADRGVLTTGSEPTLDPGGYAADWWLDELGNWAGTGTEPGHWIGLDTDGDGLPDSEEVETTHDANSDNQIGTHTQTIGGGSPAVQTFIHDRAGNLVFDGRLFYQYDGLNRLVQVNEASLLDPTPITGHFDTDGQLDPATGAGDILGPVLAAFSYDGLGRLIRTTRHDIKSVEGSSWQYEHKNQQEEHYYYDGVRRIQEVETTTPDGESSSDATRSYVWGTGYVDELVAQIEHGAGGDVVYYYLQDANYNVVGITDESGNVVRQYTWTPYGELAATEDPAGTPPLVSRVGHQGLFFERFYADPSESLLDDPALSPVDVHGGTEVLGCYHNRNRWYSPELGRFISRDPNESGLLIASAMLSNGQAMNILVDSFAGLGHYGDGMNLYQYVRSNPVIRMDPSGCFSLLDLLASACVRGTGMAATVGGGVMGLARRIAAMLNFRSIMTNLYLRASTSAGQAASYLQGLYQRTAQATRAFWSSPGSGQDLVANLVIKFGQNANQTYHAFRHTDKLGLDRAVVRAAINADLTPKLSQLVQGQSFIQAITVAGQQLKYHAYLLSNGVVNVGRIDVFP